MLAQRKRLKYLWKPDSRSHKFYVQVGCLEDRSDGKNPQIVSTRIVSAYIGSAYSSKQLNKIMKNRVVSQPTIKTLFMILNFT